MNNHLRDDGDLSQGRSTYQISVSGYLDIKWSDCLSGMSISHYESADGECSLLTGGISDQSELLGVLNTLNDYHFPIISLNKINS